MTPTEKAELQSLMQHPAFSPFLLRMVERSGIFSVATTGADDRDLNFAEGRRSICLETLAEVESAQAAPSPTSIPMVTSIQMFVQAAQSAPKEKPLGRRSGSYGDLDGDDSA